MDTLQKDMFHENKHLPSKLDQNDLNCDSNFSNSLERSEHVNGYSMIGQEPYFTNGNHVFDEPPNPNRREEKLLPSHKNHLKNDQKLIIETNELNADVLKDLFDDKICVLCIRNYVPKVVCEKLAAFLQEKELDPYTHEIRKDGKMDLQYFGVNRYGFPLNSIYTDDSGKNLKKYFSLALPTIRSIRKAAAPYLAPIDKFRVELDEIWPKKANLAILNGRKTFCGIGRVTPASQSELLDDQPHFDAVPTSCFPNIYKQFAANIYLNVPDEGGELEIWDVPPLDITEVESFVIPEDWRSHLPSSMKVKPGKGDLLLFNTRRPHAVAKFYGQNSRVSIQTFIGCTKEEELFLWV